MVGPSRQWSSLCGAGGPPQPAPLGSGWCRLQSVCPPQVQVPSTPAWPAGAGKVPESTELSAHEGRAPVRTCGGGRCRVTPLLGLPGGAGDPASRQSRCWGDAFQKRCRFKRERQPNSREPRGCTWPCPGAGSRLQVETRFGSTELDYAANAISGMFCVYNLVSP